MRLWRIPYRWTYRPFHNILWIVTDLRDGVKNIVRWVPRIWFDHDYAWEPLAEIMEYKLERLANAMEHGHHLNGPRDARRCRTCVTLIRRLLADDYFENAVKHHGETQYAYKLALWTQRNDQRHLGKLLGKYLNHWWE